MSAQKLEILEKMLGNSVVIVYLDTRREGVDLPDGVRTDPIAALHLSHTFDCDMQIDDSGIRANLSFQRRRYPCVLPWPCIFAIGRLDNGQTAVFTEDVPTEVRLEMEATQPQVVKKRPNLRLVS